MTEPERRPEDEPRLTKAEAKLILFGLVAILSGVFIGQNVTIVPVKFVFFTARVRLIWVFLLCILIGALLDRLLQKRGLLPSPRRKEPPKDGQPPAAPE